MVPEWPRLTVLGHGFADAGALPVGLPAVIVAAVAVTLAVAALPARRAANAALFGIRGVVLLSLVAGVYLRFGGS
jgi:hypothetical protein